MCHVGLICAVTARARGRRATENGLNPDRSSSHRNQPAPPFLRPAGLALLAAVVGLGGCDEDDQFATARSELQADPPPGSTLDFGVFVLEEDDFLDDGFLQALTVRNVGTGTLQLFEVELEGDDAAEFVLTERPGNLGPGAEDTLFIRFRPSFHHVAEATLRVRTNDPNRREVTWTLVGDARDPCRLAMDPASLRFELGEVRTVEVRTLTQSSCTLNFLDTDQTLFRILNDLSIPFTIEPGEPLVLEIEHGYFQPLLLPGEPVRQLRATAEHGQRQEMNLIGQAPIFDCVRVDPSRDILFNRTPVGAPVQAPVSVINQCDRPVQIRGLRIGTGFEYFRVVDEELVEGFELPAFERVTFRVEFNAIIRGIANGALVVLTADTRNPQFRLQLTGQAIAPQIDVFPDLLDFGTVTFRNPIGSPPRSECSSPSREVRLFTVGQASVEIESIEIDPSSDGLFVITSVSVNGEPVLDPSQPFEVPPGGTGLRIAVRFFPTRLDPPEHTGILRIRHNAQGEVDEIALRGESAPDVPVFETFEQAEGPKVDILWVIDNSCSMADEQERLIDNLSGFVDFADEEDADYQMGVTVTDGFSSDAGRLERCFPHPAVISGDYPQREDAFDCTFLVGTDGSGIEAGLGAAKRALERAQSDEPNINTGFLREDADLAIVVMSDEDDQSQNFTAIKEYFDTVKGPGRASRTKVHAIAGPTTGPCGTGGGFFNAQPGFVYKRMAEETGGLFFDICQRDWQPIFDQLGLDTFQAFDTWYLEQPADPASLRVFVDGVQIPEDPNAGYTYRFEENAVRFHGDAVPGPGQRIEVDYSTQCTP